MFRPIADRTLPPRWRVIAGFIVAPAAVAIVLAAVAPLYAGLDSYGERVWRTAPAYGLFGGYTPALVFGVPAYMLLAQRVTPTPLRCALVGAVVAALPWSFLSIGSMPDQASIDDRATVVDGVQTIYGWLEAGKFVGGIALVGALTGLLFWLIAAAGTGVTIVDADDG